MNTPEGWKLVPIEPTERMIAAAIESKNKRLLKLVEIKNEPGYKGVIGETGWPYTPVIEDYQAMLSAAPTPPEVKVGMEPVAYLFDTNMEALLPHELEEDQFKSRPELYTPLYSAAQLAAAVEAERNRWQEHINIDARIVEEGLEREEVLQAENERLQKENEELRDIIASYENQPPVAWINRDGTYVELATKSTVYGSHTIPLIMQHEVVYASKAAPEIFPGTISALL